MYRRTPKYTPTQIYIYIYIYKYIYIYIFNGNTEIIQRKYDGHPTFNFPRAMTLQFPTYSPSFRQLLHPPLFHVTSLHDVS